MRQTIITKYHGPTDKRGSRVSATSTGGNRITLDWDDEINTDQNHTAAALALARKMDWRGHWVGGTHQKTGYVYCNDDGDGFTLGAPA